MPGTYGGVGADASALRIQRFGFRHIIALGGRDLTFFGQIVLHRVIAGSASFLLRAGRRKLRLSCIPALYPSNGRFSMPPWGKQPRMNDSNDPRKWRGSAPLPYYAIILGVLVIGALLFGTQYGRAKQNPIPFGAPAPSASSAR